MQPPPVGAVEQAAEAHAQHIVARYGSAVAQDCAPQMLQEPADLYRQLEAAACERYVILGHARIGLQHVFKIRYFGAATLTVQHRFGAVDGVWRVLESEQV